MIELVRGIESMCPRPTLADIRRVVEPLGKLNRPGHPAMHRFMMSLSIAILVAAAAPTSMVSNQFGSEIKVATARMMRGMQVQATGDVDRDFAAMMIAHHQGAIDMAVAELRYGTNPQLKRIAQEIIVDQQQEIAAMRLAVGDSLPAPKPVPTQPPSLKPGQEH